MDMDAIYKIIEVIAEREPLKPAHLNQILATDLTRGRGRADKTTKTTRVKIRVVAKISETKAEEIAHSRDIRSIKDWTMITLPRYKHWPLKQSIEMLELLRANQYRAEWDANYQEWQRNWPAIHALQQHRLAEQERERRLNCARQSRFNRGLQAQSDSQVRHQLDRIASPCTCSFQVSGKCVSVVVFEDKIRALHARLGLLSCCGECLAVVLYHRRTCLHRLNWTSVQVNSAPDECLLCIESVGKADVRRQTIELYQACVTQFWHMERNETLMRHITAYLGIPPPPLHALRALAIRSGSGDEDTSADARTVDNNNNGSNRVAEKRIYPTTCPTPSYLSSSLPLLPSSFLPWPNDSAFRSRYTTHQWAWELETAKEFTVPNLRDIIGKVPSVSFLPSSIVSERCSGNGNDLITAHHQSLFNSLTHQQLDCVGHYHSVVHLDPQCLVLPLFDDPVYFICRMGHRTKVASFATIRRLGETRLECATCRSSMLDRFVTSLCREIDPRACKLLLAGGSEVDVWLPSLNKFIEIQGTQHKPRTQMFGACGDLRGMRQRVNHQGELDAIKKRVIGESNLLEVWTDSECSVTIRRVLAFLNNDNTNHNNNNNNNTRRDVATTLLFI